MSNNLQTELDAILHGAAFAPITDRAFLRITGSDATRWLNGMVTNSTQALQPGEGCYNFLLNAQGRIQGDCTIYRDGETFLLETGTEQIDTVQALLDKFIIMDDVELAREYREEHSLLVIGPQAKQALLEVGLAIPEVRYILHASYAHEHEPILVISSDSDIAPGYELHAEHHVISSVKLVLHTFNAVGISGPTLEAFRILSGTPKFGTDIRDRDLPQETNQTHALHFAKGCYLGQEIVERIRSRGQVHRLLTAFRLEGDLPATLPAPLEANGKPAGEITSFALVPLREGDQVLALGYARREALDTNQTLTYAGGTAVPRAASKNS